MSVPLKRIESCYQFIASKKLTLILLMLLGIILIPGTLKKTEEYSLGIPGSVVFGLLGLNLILCTVQRIKTLPKSVLIIHIGTLLTFAGAVISSFGFVATVNIYEGSSVDTVYRWDKKKNMPLGVDLEVKKINVKYYPVPVKVGVLKGTDKAGLFVLRTGESFNIGDYTVKVESLDLSSQNLILSVFNPGSLIGSAQTEGENNLPADFPYDFKLVAYRDPSLFRMWVDLVLRKDNDTVAEGTSEVNTPLIWEDLKFYFTKSDADQYGNPYAGIQITYDPGVTYVYAGFIVLGIGCLTYMYRRLRGYR